MDSDDRSMQDLKPTVWIGKQGCSGTMIEEIASQLKKRKLIKVKWLQNAEVDPAAVAAEANAILVGVRGRTMILAEKGRTPPKTPAKSPGTARSRVIGKLKPVKKKE
ncbi:MULTISPECIES: YhbY family RNA-binding protein [unclassified Methanoregula]|uniref:YhbY family RNA-binding protein n=1 Tax=unclassified Methanoregula TaxID=2649730 RepID=UPI0009C66E78|nr:MULTISPECIES: YhbY family RNA-binding protein [unclassified Methanoregula]OPX64471.1 MAG: CRS1 / YhbY (CRM) domain protein [Methanoregula sp. PtaB.Bin085]OPY35870.1 MAG: CRS1 / YhbY (CRM) domain protein [Methanoregula sp. PtaU1.Bin006]